MSVVFYLSAARSNLPRHKQSVNEYDGHSLDIDMDSAARKQGYNGFTALKICMTSAGKACTDITCSYQDNCLSFYHSVRT